jgi:hypothetical protein
LQSCIRRVHLVRPPLLPIELPPWRPNPVFADSDQETEAWTTIVTSNTDEMPFNYDASLIDSYFLMGRAMAQAVSRRPLTAEPRVRDRPVHVGFMVDRVALGQVCLRVLGFPPSVSFHGGSYLGDDH